MLCPGVGRARLAPGAGKARRDEAPRATEATGAGASSARANGCSLSCDCSATLGARAGVDDAVVASDGGASSTQAVLTDIVVASHEAQEGKKRQVKAHGNKRA